MYCRRLHIVYAFHSSCNGRQIARQAALLAITSTAYKVTQIIRQIWTVRWAPAVAYSTVILYRTYRWIEYTVGSFITSPSVLLANHCEHCISVIPPSLSCSPNFYHLGQCWGGLDRCRRIVYHYLSYKPTRCVACHCNNHRYSPSTRQHKKDSIYNIKDSSSHN